MHRYRLREYLNKRFLSLRLQKKIFYGFLILIIGVALLIGGTASFVSYEALMKNTINYGKDYLEQFSENLEYKTRRLLDNTYSLMSDKDLLKLLEASTGDRENLSVNMARKKVREIGRRYITSNAEVQTFYIVDNNGILYWYGKYGDGSESQLIDNNRAKSLVNEMENKIQNVQGEKAWEYNKEEKKVYLGRTLFDPSYVKKKLATIVFVIDNRFWEDSQIRDNADRKVIAFYHKQSDMVYAASDKAIKLVKENKIAKANENISVSKEAIYKKKPYIAMVYNSPNTTWDVYYFVAKEIFFTDIHPMLEEIGVIVLIIIAVALYISYYLAGNMVENLDRLEKNMQKLEDGDFHIRIKPSSYDEVGQLCMRFNFMANKIDELVQKAYKDGIAQQKLEMQVLKAQVNPHFLYNTLGSIKCIAKMRGQDEIEEMTTVLIDLLRTSLSKKSEFRKVKEEVAYIQGYFLLQRYRYGELFKVVYHLDPKLEDCIILDFLLQPLVENALFHGIDMVEENGIITVSSYTEENTLILSVEDNGSGMSEEQMRNILKTDTKRYEGLNSIGVHNVNERIKKYFGENYGLRYKKAESGGTLVKVILPLLYTDEEVSKCLKF